MAPLPRISDTNNIGNDPRIISDPDDIENTEDIDDNSDTEDVENIENTEDVRNVIIGRIRHIGHIGYIDNTDDLNNLNDTSDENTHEYDYDHYLNDPSTPLTIADFSLAALRVISSMQVDDDGNIVNDGYSLSRLLIEDELLGWDNRNISPYRRSDVTDVNLISKTYDMIDEALSDNRQTIEYFVDSYYEFIKSTHYLRDYIISERHRVCRDLIHHVMTELHNVGLSCDYTTSDFMKDDEDEHSMYIAILGRTNLGKLIVECKYVDIFECISDAVDVTDGQIRDLYHYINATVDPRTGNWNAEIPSSLCDFLAVICRPLCSYIHRTMAAEIILASLHPESELNRMFMNIWCYDCNGKDVVIDEMRLELSLIYGRDEFIGIGEIERITGNGNEDENKDENKNKDKDKNKDKNENNHENNHNIITVSTTPQVSSVSEALDSILKDMINIITIECMLPMVKFGIGSLLENPIDLQSIYAVIGSHLQKYNFTSIINIASHPGSVMGWWNVNRNNFNPSRDAQFQSHVRRGCSGILTVYIYSKMEGMMRFQDGYDIHNPINIIMAEFIRNSVNDDYGSRDLSDIRNWDSYSEDVVVMLYRYGIVTMTPIAIEFIKGKMIRRILDECIEIHPELRILNEISNSNDIIRIILEYLELYQDDNNQSYKFQGMINIITEEGKIIDNIDGYSRQRIMESLLERIR